MKILIVEDEIQAAKRIKRLLLELNPAASINGPIDTIEELNAINFDSYDLILSDIQLADGLSIKTYQQKELKTPIIFTTAYNEFAIEAFELNSVHYLLKPIAKDKLSEALNKFEKSKMPETNLTAILEKLTFKNFQQGFTFKVGTKIIPVRTKDILFFKSIESLSYAYLSKERRYPVELSIEQLQNILDPADFYKLNRGIICSRTCIEEIKTGLNGKLNVRLSCGPEETVSRERAKEFRAWLTM